MQGAASEHRTGGVSGTRGCGGTHEGRGRYSAPILVREKTFGFDIPLPSFGPAVSCDDTHSLNLRFDTLVHIMNTMAGAMQFSRG